MRNLARRTRRVRRLVQTRCARNADGAVFPGGRCCAMLLLARRACRRNSWHLRLSGLRRGGADPAVRQDQAPRAYWRWKAIRLNLPRLQQRGGRASLLCLRAAGRCSPPRAGFQECDDQYPRTHFIRMAEAADRTRHHRHGKLESLHIRTTGVNALSGIYRAATREGGPGEMAYASAESPASFPSRRAGWTSAPRRTS